MSNLVTIPGGTYNAAIHEYRDAENIIVPSTTQILDGVGLIDYDAVPGDTLEKKSILGDAVHFATEAFDFGLAVDPSTMHDDLLGYLLGYEEFKSDTGFVPERTSIENTGIHAIRGMRYGYRWDRLGRFRGLAHRCLLEIKCAYREEASWRYQLSGYEETVKKEPGEFIARVAVQLKKDGKYEIFMYEDSHDREVFEWALALTYKKIHHKLRWKKD
jgi:hypothetical protein